MPEITIGSRTFRLIDCFKCGVEFAVPKTLDETAMRDKQDFWCPNGHSQHYTKSHQDTINALRKDVAEAIAARDALEAKLRRVENGVCPECRRSFKNLHRHMKTKHRK